jgi:predicted phage terminase large subunit-like protein
MFVSVSHDHAALHTRISIASLYCGCVLVVVSFWYMHNSNTPEIIQDAAAEVEEFFLRHEKAKARCEESLFAFFVQAWANLEGRFKLDVNWHMGLIAEHLEAVYDGQIEKLIINVPTRYLKSNICTIAFPAWCWVQDPKVKLLSWSYANELSVALSWKRRQLLESEWFKLYWGDKISMTDDQNLKGFYANTAGGEMKASSTGASMTGSGCDIMVIDDPQNPSEASSDLARERTNEFWSGTASSRFDDKKKKSCVLVMQRLHERDLTGYFLSEYPECVHLKIPNQAPERIVYSYPRSGRIKVFDAGEILQPNREGHKELEQAKRELGSFNYAAQRQQEPVPRGGGIIKENWFKFYDVAPERFDLITLSLDCAFKDLDSSDYVVLQAWGQKGSQHFLLRQLRAKLSYLKTREAVGVFTGLFPQYHELLIEDKANGTAILNSLSGVVRSMIAISPKESKIARLVSCEPQIEAGDVFLPNPDFNTWVKNDFIPEVTAFPKAENDDQVDAMSQYLNRARDRKVGKFVDEDVQMHEQSNTTFAGGLD